MSMMLLYFPNSYCQTYSKSGSWVQFNLL